MKRIRRFVDRLGVTGVIGFAAMGTVLYFVARRRLPEI